MPSLFAEFPTDRDDRLRRSNVVTRMIFNFIICRAKTVGEILLRVRESVSVAHNRILADLTHSTHLAAVLLTADDGEIAPRFAITQAGVAYFLLRRPPPHGYPAFFQQTFSGCRDSAKFSDKIKDQANVRRAVHY